jgi:hypothetical protein
MLSWFTDIPYTGTQQNRSDKMHRQPAPTSQALLASLVEAYARGERLADDAFYQIGVLCSNVWNISEPRK